MKTTTLVRLAPIAVLCLLTACGGSPENPTTPSTTPAVSAPAGSSESSTGPAKSVAPSDGPSSSNAGSAPASPASNEPAAPDEIPDPIRGRWITVNEGGTPRECTEEVEAEGAIITIDDTAISAFAFVFELQSVEESDADSMEGVFAYHDDSDQLMTPRIKLATNDDWQTLEFIELDTEGQAPAFYARCP